jgi:hypothetical protein
VYAFSVFHATADRTLIGVEQYLDVETIQNIRFLVYQSPTQFGNYNNIASNAVTPAAQGQAYLSSGPMNVPLVAGNYYLIGVWWGTGAERYAWSAGASATTAFGTSVGIGLYGSGNVLSQVTYSSAQQNGVLEQRLHTVGP